MDDLDEDHEEEAADSGGMAAQHAPARGAALRPAVRATGEGRSGAGSKRMVCSGMGQSSPKERTGERRCREVARRAEATAGGAALREACRVGEKEG